MKDAAAKEKSTVKVAMTVDGNVIHFENMNLATSIVVAKAVADHLESLMKAQKKAKDDNTGKASATAHKDPVTTTVQEKHLAPQSNNENRMSRGQCAWDTSLPAATWTQVGGSDVHPSRPEQEKKVPCVKEAADPAANPAAEPDCP